jgi:hypothetical protein
MASPPVRNGVTWKGLIAMLALLLGMISTGFAAVMMQHTAQPHAKALGRDEYDRSQDSMGARLDRIESKIDRLIERN